LTGAIEAKFAVDFWMQIKALFTVRASREVFAVFSWMDEGAVLLVQTMWKMLAPDLFFGALLAWIGPIIIIIPSLHIFMA